MVSLQELLMAAFAIFIIYQILTYIKFLLDASKYPPRVTSWIPFFGNVVGFGTDPFNFIKNGAKLGDAFTSHVLGKEMTFLTHPRVYDAFFKGIDEEVGTMEVYQLMTPVFGRGVVYDARSVSEMMEQLQFVTSGMTANNFKRYARVFEEETSKMLDKLPESGSFNPYLTLAEIIISTAARCLIGDEVHVYLDSKELAKLYHDLDVGINPLTFFFPYLTFLPGSGARDTARTRIISVFQNIIDERRKHPDKVVDDTLDILMKASYKSGEKIPDSHICGILLAGLFAGEHTSAVTSTWTLMNVLKHPQVKAKILKEQKEVLGNDSSITYENVKLMDYMTMTIRETIRLFPPIIMLFRKVKKDRKIPGSNLVVPKGNIIVVPVSNTHHLSDVYPNPEAYEPERWGRDRSEHEKVPYSFLGFGAGRHKCLGENFAIYQVASILSIFFRNLDMNMDGVEMPKVDTSSLVAGPLVPDCKVYFKKIKQ